MKKKHLLWLLLVPIMVIAADLKNSMQLVTTNSTTTVPCRLVSNTSAIYYAGKITLIGNKDIRTANTGTVYVGVNPTNDTQAIPITSGQVVTLTPPIGEQVRLYDWFLDVGTTGDGVCIIWTP